MAVIVRMSGLVPYTLKFTHYAITLTDDDIDEILGEE